MTIETKYNIGDKVWALIKNKPKEFIIMGIKYTANNLYKGCDYYIKSSDCDYETLFPEELIFHTKEEIEEFIV